uniref:Usherin n=1 Tax=Latimeria chalumnae TaxID=7897 RepID=H3A4S8_LATCH
CCDGVLYNNKPVYECCEDKYIRFSNTTLGICCGGRFHTVQPGYQCCGGYYVRVLSGEVCCPSKEQNRVSVGVGDSCCGGNPYSVSWGQICCAGSLYDGFNQQCCGGQVVSSDLVCCGNEEKGSVQMFTPGMSCCGQEFVNVSDTICCSGPGGESKAHNKKNDTDSVKCCGIELIPRSQKCCNGAGYNPLNYVCADKPSSGMAMKKECSPSKLCPISNMATAYCGECDFKQTTNICTWMIGPRSTLSSEVNSGLCPSAEEMVYSGGPSRYSFTDITLDPYVTYEYRVAAWNSYGRGHSNVSRASTEQDVPQAVSPPKWSKVDNREDMILLNWKAPAQPNVGVIIHYIILRDGVERFRGMKFTFTDTGGIQPYQEYTYQVRACTVIGCTESSKVVAVTVQGIPEDLHPPTVTALSPTALQLSWREPGKPNGIIREYQIYQNAIIPTISVFKWCRLLMSSGNSRVHSYLWPHAYYSFAITACTSAGCSTSQPSIGRTLQAAPQGVWSKPRHVIATSRIVELYWNHPEKPNGIISLYNLIRDGAVIFTGDSEHLNYTDADLQPNTRYAYQLEASSGGGSSISEKYVIQTPISTPERISAPYNVTVIGPHSLFVAWAPPVRSSGFIQQQYNVTLNIGSSHSVIRPAGHYQFLLVEGLTPYTQYRIRIQACQEGGCGVGEGAFIRTTEAPPEDLRAPTVTATGPAVIEVKWSPPKKPNGIITNYFIYRRPVGTQDELLVLIWSEGALEFIDASDMLQPYTEYEYRVRAHNSRGSVDSQWSSTQTLEAPPQGVAAPSAQATSAYSVLVNWTQPTSPNGIISQYRVVYQEQRIDPTISTSAVTALTVPATSNQAHVFGLEPFTTYNIHVVAVNNAGQVTSPWTNVRTLEASPSGLSNFTVEKRENGRALLLKWSEPSKPNGVIKQHLRYNIFSDDNLEYSGLSRQFLFRRLEPYTIYTLVLEACTEEGCTRSPPQPVRTDEAPPSSQPAPVAKSVNAASIELKWSKPLNPNGKIIRYEIIYKHNKGNLTGIRATSTKEKVVFTEFDNEMNEFIYTDRNLHPWTRYEYKVRAWNSAGYTDSSWIVAETSQSAPKGLAPPKVRHIPDNPFKLILSWVPPEDPNGVLQSFRLQRDNILFPFSFDALTFNYTDEDLMPYTTYSYSIIACTMGGCCTSELTTVRTLESSPASVRPPSLQAISSTKINVSWSAPLLQNGEIVKYILLLNNEEHYSGKHSSSLVTGLQPYTEYNFTLVVCTNGGCTSSSNKSAWTMEALPMNMRSPRLQVIRSESIEVTWHEPANPNGQIRAYELRRNGVVIYSGPEVRYCDFSLTPGMEYSYTVTAMNSQGSVTSPSAKARTNPSAPSGVAPPKLQMWRFNEILVTWDPPTRANGEIINYTLLNRAEAIPQWSQRDQLGQQEVQAAPRPYDLYEVRIEACTVLGCASGDWASIQTLEVPPAMQLSPILERQTDSRGFQSVFRVLWSKPQQPNGKILYYELYRKQMTNPVQDSRLTLVYNGSSTSFQDTGLLPYTTYDYQVWAINSAGRTSSAWTRSRTGPAAPEGVYPPTFSTVSATTAVINITPPIKPNGIVSLYRVFASNIKERDLLLSEGTTGQLTIHGLKPFTTYSVGVEACTCFQCCSKGPVTQVTTRASAPSNQPPPLINAVTSRGTSLQWSVPQSPNGIIQSYELQIRTACPQPSQPIIKICSPGPSEVKYSGQGQSFNVTDLEPYTNYNLRVICYNFVGSTASEWITITTLKEMPEYRAPFIVNSNLSTIYLDWSHSFLLNGKLKNYVLTENGARLYNGFDSTLHIRKTSEKTFQFQVTCNTDSGSVSTPVIPYNPATGLSFKGAVIPTVSGKSGVENAKSKFYTELWFIIIMAIVGLILLAVFLNLLLRMKRSRQPYERERPPLVPLQKRMSPMNIYTPISSTITLDAVNSETNLSSQSKSLITLWKVSFVELNVPSQSQISRAYSQSSLHRSVSQLIDNHDKKSLFEDSAWDTVVHGHDSGTVSFYMDDEDLMDTIKGFSKVTKEHTMFTDTHL